MHTKIQERQSVFVLLEEVRILHNYNCKGPSVITDVLFQSEISTDFLEPHRLTRN